MGRLRLAITRRRDWFAVLIACALAVRLLVPAGWMPAADAAGRISIAICSGSAPGATMTLPMAHDEAPVPGHGSEHPCAFAGAATPLAAVVLPAILPPMALTALPTSRRHLVSVGRGLAAPPPPQTGPPGLI